jgi:hypothetical protein
MGLYDEERKAILDDTKGGPAVIEYLQGNLPEQGKEFPVEKLPLSVDPNDLPRGMHIYRDADGRMVLGYDHDSGGLSTVDRAWGPVSFVAATHAGTTVPQNIDIGPATGKQWLVRSVASVTTAGVPGPITVTLRNFVAGTTYTARPLFTGAPDGAATAWPFLDSQTAANGQGVEIYMCGTRGCRIRFEQAIGVAAGNIFGTLITYQERSIV